MKAAVFTKPFNFEIVDMEKPIPQKGEVLLKVMSVGICGSDMGPFNGKDMDRRQPGIIMGHEATGRVEALGEGASLWKIGDRVAINPQIYCGRCFYCQTGAKNLCDNMLLIGSSKRKFLHGAMCEYICLSENQLLKLPDNVSFDEGALLDPVGNAIRVVRRGKVGIGDNVVVIGCGAIGLMILQTAGIAGAANVIAVNRFKKKKEIALDLGANYYVSSDDEEKALQEINNITKGKGADVVIDAAGFPSTYNFAVNCCKKGGRIVALGYNGTHLEFPLTNLIFKEIQLIGSTGFSEESSMVLDYISNGKIKLGKIITGKFALEDTQKAFEAVNNGNGIKVIINP
jgi:L-iditol 2-dehydrogenase